MAEKNEEELKRKYVHLQLLHQQAVQLHKQVQAFEAQLGELDNVRNALAEISHAEIGRELFAPLSGGIFIKAELKDNQDLLVNVGGNTCVKKTVPDTIKMIDDQINEITDYKEQIKLKVHEIVSRMRKIEAEMEAFAK